MALRACWTKVSILLVLLLASAGCGRIWFDTRDIDRDADVDDASMQDVTEGPRDGAVDGEAFSDAPRADAATDADTCTCECASDHCEDGVCAPAVVVSTVSMGPEHTFVITTDGAMYGWGRNTAAELGIGEIGAGTERLVPTRVGAERSWSRVAAGFFHTCAIATDATLWCWGSDAEGRLGVGDVTAREEPTQVVGGRTWTRVSAGNVHTCGIQPDGSLWCWGANASGQLGLGDRDNRTGPERVGTDNDWRDVHVASFHTCAVRTDGTQWCWGFNSNGELGLGSAAAGVTYDVPQQVGTDTTWRDPLQGISHYHACSLQTDNTLWCWGANEGGRTGLGTTMGSTTTPMQITAPAEWEQASPGYDYTCGVARGGLAWCFGHNDEGKLGTGDTTFSTVPVRVLSDLRWSAVLAGGVHTCGITTSGALWCWGSNELGSLGLGDRTGHTTPTRVCLPEL